MRGSRHAERYHLLRDRIIPAHAGLTALAALVVAMLRIIPAHAGLTYSAPRPILAVGDHPRACGAHMAQTVAMTL